MLENRIALVTGASRGIGYHIALELARLGAHVIAVARTVGGLEALDDEIAKLGGSTTLVPMDLTDYEAIDRLGQAIHERWGQLDIFVANAGILGGLSPVEHFDIKDFGRVMDVNLTANWRLIRSLDPLLKQSDSARAIVVGAPAAQEHRPFWGAYAASKAALETLALTWAAETKNTAMRINMLIPEPARTALRAQAMPGEDTEQLQSPAKVAECIEPLVSPELETTGAIFRQETMSFVRPG